MFIDKRPYQAFKKLKEKHSVVTVLVTDKDFSTPMLRTAFKTYREFLVNEFKHKGIEIYRWSHDYESLDGPHPKLGLVYMANDSVIVPGIEVHALVGHNARSIYET